MMGFEVCVVMTVNKVEEGKLYICKAL